MPTYKPVDRMNFNIPPPPPSYMRELPEGASVITVDGRTLEHTADTTTWDSLSPGAVAQLPSGLEYIKTGDIWLLAPMPNPLPMVLTGQVPGHQEYWIIQQTPYRGDDPIDEKDAIVIPFNVPMSRAKEGDLPGAGENVFARPAHAYDEDEDDELDVVRIYMSFHAVMGKPFAYPFDVAMTATKGELANNIAQEVERIFLRTNNVPIAFMNKLLCKEADFTDTFLVNLVQRAEEVFQPTLAVRVQDSEVLQDQ